MADRQRETLLSALIGVMENLSLQEMQRLNITELPTETVKSIAQLSVEAINKNLRDGAKRVSWVPFIIIDFPKKGPSLSDLYKGSPGSLIMTAEVSYMHSFSLGLNN